MAPEQAEPQQPKAEVPEKREAICLKCLKKDPVARSHSALKLAVVLFRFHKLCKHRQGRAVGQDADPDTQSPPWSAS